MLSCTCSSVSNTTYGLFSCVSNTTYMFYLAVLFTCSSVSNTTYGLFSCVSNTTHGLFSNTTYMFYLAVHVQCISTCTSDVQCMYMYILIYRNINTLYFHSIL